MHVCTLSDTWKYEGQPSTGKIGKASSMWCKRDGTKHLIIQWSNIKTLVCVHLQEYWHTWKIYKTTMPRQIGEIFSCKCIKEILDSLSLDISRIPTTSTKCLTMLIQKIIKIQYTNSSIYHQLPRLVSYRTSSKFRYMTWQIKLTVTNSSQICNFFTHSVEPIIALNFTLRD